MDDDCAILFRIDVCRRMVIAISASQAIMKRQDIRHRHEVRVPPVPA